MNWVKNNQQTTLTKDVILQHHQIVTENTLESDDVNFQGEFRNDRVFVGHHEGIEHANIENVIDEMIPLKIINPRYYLPLIKGILVSLCPKV